MPETYSAFQHPQDIAFKLNRKKLVDELLKMNTNQLDLQLQYQMKQAPEIDQSAIDMSRKIVGEIYNAPYTPQAVKNILDTGGATSGNVLIRQDLEAPMYALFVKTFPAWERMRKAQSNGLVHAATQITSPEHNFTLGGTVISELGSVAFQNSDYNRVTFPISVFATGRGVGIKELAAVRAGGANYDPMRSEMANGMTRLAMDAQWMLLQGNAQSSNSGGNANNEMGPYNSLYFDGFRGVLGSAGTAWAGNNAVQVDIGSLNISESIQTTAAKIANNGGSPDMVLMSIQAKQALDIEQQNNRRYNDATTEITPGLRVNRLSWANGELDILPIPGNTLGNYVRSSDNANVEDIYILDSSTNTVRWLYSEGLTVLQIPTGIPTPDGNNVLSERFVIFGMYGLEQAAPVFNGKCRRILA